MHILVFLSPKWSRILLYEAVDIFIWTILDFAIYRSCFRAELLPEIIDHTCGFSDFKSSILVIAHAIPGVLTSYSQSFSTIHVDNLSSDFPRVLWCQMNDCMAYLLDISGSPHWICICFLFHYWLVFKLSEACLSVHICVKERWGYTVNSYTESSELQSRWFCHHFKTCFRHAIRNKPRLWFWSFHARNVDNTSLSCDNHILEEI